MTKAQEVPVTEVQSVDIKDLVRKVLAQVETGKISLGEAIAAVLDGKISIEDVTPVVPAVIAITEADQVALVAIVDQYGKVAPSTARLLSKAEQKAIVEERVTIDKILGLLKTRKDTSIRETLANHLDRAAERDGKVKESTERDSRGHFCLKQDEPVADTSLKISRSVSEPKPVVSSAELFKAYESGALTREEYLAVTVVPDVSRVFDETKARKAMGKDPSLLFKLANATTQAAKTTTIKCLPNKG